MIHVSRLFYSKYRFKLIATHYIIWMNFNVMSIRFYFGKPLTWGRYGLIRSHWKSYRYFIILWEAHLDVVQEAAHIQQYFIQPLIQCHWKLISQTAGWRTLNSVFFDHFKKGVSCCIVNRLLMFINNSAKDQYFLNDHKRKWFQLSFFNLILKIEK